jgi:DNA-binding transcriptional LysR family regulator
MNLNQLRVFNAVCEELSITAAARRLRISQPAVSKQVAELEQALGAVLVDRMPRGIRLTAAGELLASHARRLFREEAEAEAALAELLGLRGGRLALGASTTIGGYLVPRVLGDFQRRYPKVSLQLHIDNTRSITEALLEGRLDIGLTEGLVAGEALPLQEQVLTQDEMVVLVAAGHPLARRPQVTLAELAVVPWLSRERGSGTREVVEAALTDLGLTLEPTMSLGSNEAVKNAAALGMGFAVLSRLTVELELHIGRLVALDVTGLCVRRDLHLLTVKGKHPSTAAAEFLRVLRVHYP